MPPKMGRTIQARQHKQAKKIKREESTKPRRCYLLELPAEIRNYIVELVLNDTGKFSTWIMNDLNCGIDNPAIADTCRRLRTETLPVFYSQHSLHLQDLDLEGEWDEQKPWLKAIAEHIPFLGKLCMHFCMIHQTMLVVEVKRYRGRCRVTCMITMVHFPQDGERSKGMKKWREIAPVVRDTFNYTGQHRPTVEDYILAVNIMVHTEGR